MSAVSSEELRDRILSFVTGCKNQRPVLKEVGGETMPLEPGRFSVEAQHGKVLLEVWDESRSIVRRILEVRRQKPGELVLAYQRFGAGRGLVRLLASAKGVTELEREAVRSRFAARLRKLLAHTFPGWKLKQLTAERDLERSLSSQTARAVLSRGKSDWAVVGCAEEEGEATAASALTQGLAWLDSLRHSAARSKRLVAGLKLFLSERFVERTALRWRYLNQELAGFELFAFSPEDTVRRAEEGEYANLRTELPMPCPAATAPAEALGLLRRLGGRSGVEMAVRPGAGLTCRINGLEFARAGPDGAMFGRGSHWQPLVSESLPQAECLAQNIGRIRVADSANRRHPFYTAQAERWLESLLVRDIGVLSSDLDPRFVYFQVPAVAGRQRGIIDLLALTRTGRLVVIELKASADPNLPLQALDYWMRVKWHQERGESRSLGYFSGVELRAEPPLLWLVAPVFEFHSLTDLLLRYLSPEIPVRRIGLNHTWRQSLQVVLRN